MKNQSFLALLTILFSSSIFAQSDQPVMEVRDQSLAGGSATTHPEYRSPALAYAPANIPGPFFRGVNRKAINFENSKSSGSLSLKAGTVVGFSAAGDTQFIAHYKRNKLKGNWLSRFENDQLCDSGTLKNNIPDGLWKSWYANGQLRFIRNYDAFKLEKAKQDIRLRQSKAVSSPIATVARKNLRVAYSYLHPDYSFHTLAHQPETFTTYDEWMTLNERVANNISDDGISSYYPPFLECLHHGLYMNFYPDGSVKDSGYYKNGLREGIWEEWLDDGETKSQGFYYHGHKVDTWKFYTRDGHLKYIRSFNKNGREVHRKSFRKVQG
jgi:antitoxin component YwqK of YwqJK toxin-antitoxin module